MSSPNILLQNAKNELGYCRFDDPKNGTKYGRWYAEKVGDSYYAANGVPYCAMFVSYIVDTSGIKCAGLPGAYCPYIESDMRKASMEISVQFARPGDIVLFDWNGDRVSDHIGFVEWNYPEHGYMVTLEGNTTGADGRSGSVARRSRDYSTIKACFRIPWEGDDMPTAKEVAETVWGYSINGKNAATRLRETSDDATSTFDPTGRGITMNNHDHIKYIASELKNTQSMVQSLNQRIEECADLINTLLIDSGKDGEL